MISPDGTPGPLVELILCTRCVTGDPLGGLLCGIGASDDCHILQAGIRESHFVAAEDAISAVEDIKGIRIVANDPRAAPILFENPGAGKRSSVLSEHVAAVEEASWHVRYISPVGGALFYQLDFGDFGLCARRENVEEVFGHDRGVRAVRAGGEEWPIVVGGNWRDAIAIDAVLPVEVGVPAPTWNSRCGGCAEGCGCRIDGPAPQKFVHDGIERPLVRAQCEDVIDVAQIDNRKFLVGVLDENRCREAYRLRGSQGNGME